MSFKEEFEAAVKRVAEELEAMTDEEFEAELAKYRDGDIACILRELGDWEAKYGTIKDDKTGEQK